MSEKTVRIGLLGCGAISQFAHLPALDRAGNAQLVAICDAAEDLLARVGDIAGIENLYTDHREFLKDAGIDAVLIAVPDVFHVPLTMDALRAGKHVLVEKPLGTNAQECLQLVKMVKESGLKLQVGSMKRHDPGIEFAHQFIVERMGRILSVSSWYRDTLFRPTMQEALLPKLLCSGKSIKPETDPKADKEKYSLVTHGAHLFDNLLYLGGSVSAVTTRVARRFGQYTWHGLLEFDQGGIGNFELSVKVNSDWSEGYNVYGENGSVHVRTFLPFYNRSSEVRVFDAEEQRWHSPLGADSNPYKRQIESFARAVLEDEDPSPNVYDGIAAIRLLEAVEKSAGNGSRVDVVRDKWS